MDWVATEGGYLRQTSFYLQDILNIVVIKKYHLTSMFLDNLIVLVCLCRLVCFCHVLQCPIVLNEVGLVGIC